MHGVYTWRAVAAFMFALCYIFAAFFVFTVAKISNLQPQLLDRVGIQLTNSHLVKANLMLRANPLSARSEAIVAFRNDPISVSALAIVATADHALGDEGETNSVLDAASRLSLRNGPLNRARVAQALRGRHLGILAKRVDIALRTEQRPNRELRQLLQTLCLNPEFSQHFARRLALFPHYRLDFFRAANAGSDWTRSVAIVVDAMVLQRQTLTSEEAANYFMAGRFVIDTSRLRRQWQSIAPDVDHLASRKAVYDGNFQGLQGTLPFNWQLGSDGASSAQIVDVGNAHHLSIDTGNGDDRSTWVARQWLALSPGSWELAMIGVNDSAPLATSIAARVACSASGRQIADISLGSSRQEAISRTAFTVPQDCSGQILELSIARDLMHSTAGEIRVLSLDIKPVYVGAVDHRH